MKAEKKIDNSGAALYLVVVFTAISVTLLMLMYANISATSISTINSGHRLQDKLYIESIANMIRDGKSIEEIDTMALNLGIKERLEIKLESITSPGLEINPEVTTSTGLEINPEVTTSPGLQINPESTTSPGLVLNPAVPQKWTIKLGKLTLKFTLINGKYVNYHLKEEV